MQLGSGIREDESSKEDDWSRATNNPDHPFAKAIVLACELQRVYNNSKLLESVRDHARSAEMEHLVFLAKSPITFLNWIAENMSAQTPGGPSRDQILYTVRRVVGYFRD